MKFSEETRAKMSAVHTGVPKSKDHVKAVRDAIWGKDYIPLSQQLTPQEFKDRTNALRRERRKRQKVEEVS
jgi:hypothetical protein